MRAQTGSISEPVVIEWKPKVTVDKLRLLELLKLHRVETELVENSSVMVADVIPALKKAKSILPETFFRDLASELELPFVPDSDVREVYEKNDKLDVISSAPYTLIRKHGFIMVGIRGDSSIESIDVAVDNPLDQQAIALIDRVFGEWTINLHVVSSGAMEWALDHAYSKIHKQQSMNKLLEKSPEDSANKVLLPKQRYFAATVLALLVVCLVLNSAMTFIVAFATISILYFLFNPVKIFVSAEGFRGPRMRIKITKGEMQWVPDEDLPNYTVLVPVFRESNVLRQILRNIYNLNYPREKLDVKILMEENDEETLNEAKLIGLFGSPKQMVEGIPEKNYAEFLSLFDPVVIPEDVIKTKPRACNYGLLRANGELCVVFDAEDDPDPDQLRKAAIMFLRSGENVACLQSKLNFYNARENLLTKWFSIEYASWFEFYLQGLDWINAPVPLGGTSNHFRKGTLDELGAWDPYNVTEDADLGVRLARQKLKTEMLDTYTLEEATSTVKGWVHQRSRWYKGHLQTYLVHMRNPLRLARDLGTSRFLKFQLTFGASVFIPIVNPALWILFLASFLAPLVFSGLATGLLLWVCVFNLLVGNASYLLIYVVACLKLKKYRLVPLALLMPGYWVLASIASWRGLIQLVTKPFYWDKTQHGVSRTKQPSPHSELDFGVYST
jgi:cellulose synthase/poly-beta-1,6-N-acetylglucosamine synthase-like glycosyltransferase